jgi:hypothetical protein
MLQQFQNIWIVLFTFCSLPVACNSIARGPNAVTSSVRRPLVKKKLLKRQEEAAANSKKTKIIAGIVGVIVATNILSAVAYLVFRTQPALRKNPPVPFPGPDPWQAPRLDPWQAPRPQAVLQPTLGLDVYQNDFRNIFIDNCNLLIAKQAALISGREDALYTDFLKYLESVDCLRDAPERAEKIKQARTVLGAPGDRHYFGYIGFVNPGMMYAPPAYDKRLELTTSGKKFIAHLWYFVDNYKDKDGKPVAGLRDSLIQAMAESYPDCETQFLHQINSTLLQVLLEGAKETIVVTETMPDFFERVVQPTMSADGWNTSANVRTLANNICAEFRKINREGKKPTFSLQKAQDDFIALLAMENNAAELIYQAKAVFAEQ